ncbi:Protein of unknown function, partial [Gryllus bimaculatus]
MELCGRAPRDWQRVTQRLEKPKDCLTDDFLGGETTLQQNCRLIDRYFLYNKRTECMLERSLCNISFITPADT